VAAPVRARRFTPRTHVQLRPIQVCTLPKRLLPCADKPSTRRREALRLQTIYSAATPRAPPSRQRSRVRTAQRFTPRTRIQLRSVQACTLPKRLLLCADKPSTRRRKALANQVAKQNRKLRSRWRTPLAAAAASGARARANALRTYLSPAGLPRCGGPPRASSAAGRQHAANQRGLETSASGSGQKETGDLQHLRDARKRAPVDGEGSGLEGAGPLASGSGLRNPKGCVSTCVTTEPRVCGASGEARGGSAACGRERGREHGLGRKHLRGRKREPRNAKRARAQRQARSRARAARRVLEARRTRRLRRLSRPK
jgi:hypothetical protein